MRGKTMTKSVRKVNVRIKRKKELPRGIKANGRPRKPRKNLEERKKIAERQNAALDLRISGITYKEIAEALGFKSPSGAKDAVDRAISRIEVDAAKETVQMDLSRLEEFIMRCTHALRNNGDLGQIDRIMRVMEMRYRLMGITDETVRIMQAQHGVGGETVHNTTNNVQVVVAAPETEEDFLRKMMGAVGVDYDSNHAQELLKNHRAAAEGRPLPMLKGSANDGTEIAAGHKKIDDEVIDVESWTEDE